MAEVSRQEKLASAKRKLKQFQQKKTHFDTSGSSGLSNSLSLSSYSLGSNHNSPASTPQRSPSRSLTPIQKENNDRQNDQPEKNYHQVLPQSGLSFISNQNSHESNAVSAADKIKEITTQLNGLMSQDGSKNGENPIVKDIRSFEAKNSELEASLVSCKRSNRQLSDQINQQRKLIIQLQDQIKQKDKTNVSAKSFQEQKGLKEQLEVHIQTIGILVSEKTDLQHNLSSLQKKLQSKDGEHFESTSRLAAVRQRVAELERIESNLQLACDRQTQACRSLSNENDTLNGKLSAMSLKMEELNHQNSELILKLQSKAKECDDRTREVTSALGKLQSANIQIRQLSSSQSGEPNDLHQQMDVLRHEYEETKHLLQEQQNVVKDMVKEKMDLIEQHNEEKDSNENQLRALRSQNEALTIDNTNLKQEKLSLADVLASLKEELATTREANSALVNNSTTHDENTIKIDEYQKILEEKKKLDKELDIQISENRRLTMLATDSEDRILELESAVSRLGEEAVDKVSLLEDIQSDKETISRATQQNKQLKDQLEELQNAFVKMTNTNAELTDKLQKIQHESNQFESQSKQINEKLEMSLEELKSKDEELSKLKALDESRQEQKSETVNTAEYEREITNLKNQLNYQIDQNHKLHHMEARAELTDRLQVELQSAQNTINQMSTQNSMLKESLNRLQTEGQETHASDGLPPTESHPNDDTSEIHPTNESDSTNPIKADEQSEMSHEDTPNMVNIDDQQSFSGSDDSLTDESGSNLEGSELLDSYKEEVRQLQSLLHKCAFERDTATRRLELERKQANEDFTKLKEHLNLQLQQQLQQQQRQVQEHYHEQIHEQQRKMTLLQEAFDKHKQQMDVNNVDTNDLDEHQVPYDALKTAFQQLQTRFKKIMDDKAIMIEKLQDMEHMNLQLASETETIGEYITLYQTQRQALRDKFHEKERLVIQLSREHARMQSKVSQLQRLVTDVLAEKSGSEIQAKQLQELVNQRLTLQSDDGKHDIELPKLNFTSNVESDNSRTSSRSISVTESVDSELNDTDVFKQTGKAQQILQILEQLETSGEGYQRGWIAPNVRRKEFTPCKHCSRRVTVI